MRTDTWASQRQRRGRPSRQPFVVIPERLSFTGQMAMSLGEAA
ncbi:hypothetical protein Spla01_05062 [Streptomyces platensis]|uniref:Uncharacterized protein n=1 Tax=Streptomyces platensis TaxID=58346 RepID=A0ABX3Y0E7_STRPT|nr:hypothetical protein [Streptomyces platensis]OSY45770.1 hypothetical protein BG653_02795 [Streptomyces platensis]